MADKWVVFVHHVAIYGVPDASEGGDKFSGGPQVSKLVSSPLPSAGSQMLHSRAQNQQWPTYGQIGDITPAIQPPPPYRFKAGNKISSGPQVGR